MAADPDHNWQHKTASSLQEVYASDQTSKNRTSKYCRTKRTLHALRQPQLPLEIGHRQTTNQESNATSHQYTSTSDVKCMPRSPPAVTNIFKSLNHDEASWLVEEVNEANKSIFGAEQTAEKLKQEEGELDKKKMSLCALK
jgi:hypothetical protein